MITLLKKDKAILEEERKNFIYGIQAKDENGELLFNEDGSPIMEVNGCVNNGIPEDVANAIYEDIIPFADYGFNKSHAASYALVSYRTGYLKANYYLEFAVAVMRSVETNKKKLTSYASMIREDNVNILFPDINKSNKHMDIYDFESNTISTGFMAIKGLAEGVIDNLIEERNTNGAFVSFEDFLKRMAKHNIDKKAMTSLIGAGAFDCFTKNQERLLAISNSNLDYLKMVNGYITSSEGTQKTLYDIDSFRDNLDYLVSEADNNGYDLYERLGMLCEYNNVGIHSEVMESYTNIQNEFETARDQRDPEIIKKKGIVTGFLEEPFESSKSGKAYLAKMIGFDGERYKLIVTKSKAENVLGRADLYKKGMVIDVVGTFNFPNLDMVDENEDEDEENSKKKSTEVATFPSGITIKTINSPYVKNNIVIDLDSNLIDREQVFEYFGVNSMKELVSVVFSDSIVKDENIDEKLCKNIKLKYNNKMYSLNKKTIISMDTIKKLGCLCSFE